MVYLLYWLCISILFYYYFILYECDFICNLCHEIMCWSDEDQSFILWRELKFYVCGSWVWWIRSYLYNYYQFIPILLLWFWIQPTTKAYSNMSLSQFIWCYFIKTKYFFVILFDFIYYYLIFNESNDFILYLLLILILPTYNFYDFMTKPVSVPCFFNVYIWKNNFLKI